MFTIFIDQVLTKKNVGKNSEYTPYTVNKSTMGKLPKKNKIREKTSLPCGMFDKNQNFVFGCRHL